MSEPELVRVTVEAGVAVLTLDNPPLNLVTLELTRRLRAALERLAADPEARVLVVTGAGPRAFCAGSTMRYRCLPPACGANRVRPSSSTLIVPGSESVKYPSSGCTAYSTAASAGAGASYGIGLTARYASTTGCAGDQAKSFSMLAAG